MVSEVGPKGQRPMRDRPVARGPGGQGEQVEPGDADTRSVPGLGLCAQTQEDQLSPMQAWLPWSPGIWGQDQSALCPKATLALVCQAWISSVHGGLTSCPYVSHIAVPSGTQPPRAH